MEDWVVKDLRRYYGLPDDVSDDRVRKVCKGSLGEAVIRLEAAKKAFGRCMRLGAPASKWVRDISAYLPIKIGK